MKNRIKKVGKSILDACCFILCVPFYCRQKKKIEEKRIHKILLINLQGIGDILMTTPFLSALRKKYPEAQIDYLCYKDNGSLLENDMRINTLLKRAEDNLFSIDFLKTVKKIQKRKYNLVVNLFPAQHSALLTILSNAEYKLGNLWRRASTSNNLAVSEAKKTWDVRENCKNIAAQLGIEIKHPYTMQIFLDKEEEERVTKDLKKKKCIVLNPQANWVSKKWPKENWQHLIKKILQEKEYKEYMIAVIGRAQEKETTEELLAPFQRRNQEKKRVENWCGKYFLKELAAVLKHATLFITTDTGPMHIALAVKTKTIGLFGVTNPSILVKGAENMDIVSSYKQCPEKFHFNHNNEPQDGEQSCMKKISVDEVMAAVEKMLYGRK